MSIGSGSNLGPIGGNPFAGLGIDIGILLALHGITVQVTRHDTEGPSDIYGEPLDKPTPWAATLLLVKQEMKEVETEAGGKRNEVLTFVGEPGTLLENDILAYGGHEYDVRNVGRTTANSVVAAEAYVAVREVDI